MSKTHGRDLDGVVVSHTHWDRAWYLPFERFRLRLVRMVERVLDLLDRDPGFRAFTLDGQAVLLDDVLDVRPDLAPHLRAAVSSGRLSVGPWYTLPDLFLVSGESIVRNLQVGLRRCAAFGGGLREGYLPDPFGHVAQMPQILRGFGIDSYVFMRGLDASTRDAHGAVFDWRAPDGSTVLAVYQRDGYFPAANLGHPAVYGRFDGHTPRPELAQARLAEAVARQAAIQDACTVLLSNGFDHMPEQPELPRLLDGLHLEGVALRHGTLGAFFDALRAETADGTTGDGVTPRGTVEGDLLGNADHPILRSVDSTRLYLKQQNHAAESLLTRVVEPICVLLAKDGLGEPAQPFLDHAWRQLLRNHPHDDICGCSVDAAHQDGEARWRSVMQTGDELVREALETLLADGFAPPARTGPSRAAAPVGPDEPHGFGPAGPLPTGVDVFVFNPLPHDQTVEVETDILFPSPEGEFGVPPPVRPLAAVGPDGEVVPVAVLTTEAPVLRSRFLEGTWGRRYRVRLRAPVPALGYALVHVHETDSLPDEPQAEVSPLDGPQLVVGHAGPVLRDGAVVLGPLVAFEYELDAGDTYSFGPVPAHGPWVARYVGTDREPDGTLRVRHALSVPSAYDRATGPAPDVELAIETTVRLRPDGTAALAVAYTNAARDGRLRLVVPTATTADAAWTDGAFRLARRTRRANPQTPESASERWQGYPGELDYPTVHQGTFSILDGEGHHTVVANRGLPEAEILDKEGQTHLAVTLHRAVGWLSVSGGRIRRCQAGPQVPTPGAQCLREIRAEVGVGVERGGRAVAVRRAEAFAHAAFACEMPALPYLSATGERPRAASLLRLDGDDVRLTAFKPHDTDAGTFVARVHNTATAPRTAHLAIGLAVSAARRVSLDEVWHDGIDLPLDPLRPDGRPSDGPGLDGRKLRVELATGQIATVLLR